ncbi:MAG TPA: hypothetical protein VHM91_20295 [Verrucomicrobiales bacterium]|jgi:hypothetical protein|nr:hypothetical protein [Verrucomicrobiales bacterium]
MAGSSVVCPFCRTKVSVPDDAPVIQEEASQSQIPAARAGDNMMSNLRGSGREDWEIGKRPIGGDLEFRQRLHSTSTPDRHPNAPGQPEVHRVNMRRRKHELTHGDFDDPEQASRRRSGRRKIRSHGQAFGKTMVRGLVVCVIILAGAVGWLAWNQYHKPKPESTRKPQWVQQGAVTTLEPGGPKLETRSIVEYGAALRETVTRFVSAPTLDEMLKHVRDRARVEPKIRAFYHKDNPWHPIEIRNTFDPAESVKVDGNFITFQLSLANYDEVPIGLERKGDAFLVDWECFTAYGDLTWDELQSRRPQQPVLMRAVIEHSVNTDYFNGAFTEAKYHCYLVRDLKSRHLISGYCLKDSPLDTVIRKHLVLQPPPSSMYSGFAVIRLRFPENISSNNQVEITEFLQNGWIFRPDNK